MIVFVSWKPDSSSELLFENSARKFATTAIQHAMKNKCQTVAFPALGCGAFNCDAKEVAKSMIFEANKQLQCNAAIVKHISFIIERKKTAVYDIFCEYFKRQSFSQHASRNDGLPHEWETTNNEYPLQINLSASSEEYRKVLRDFYQTMSKNQIESIRIEKIQNERLYRQYQIEKEHLNNVLNRDTERILFHGCSDKKGSPESIMKHGLDRSMAGTTWGTRYGKGVYFSTKASQSHTFTKPDPKTKERNMFVCYVLTGVSTLGNKEMNVCPEGYNSTTDGSTIYVVYRDAQVYTGYLIHYKWLSS